MGAAPSKIDLGLQLGPFLRLGLVVAFTLLVRKSSLPGVSARARTLLRLWAPVAIAGSVVFLTYVWLGSLDLLPLVFAVLFPLSLRGSLSESGARLLSSAWVPAAVGAATALMVWWIWGSLRAAPIVHDEAAYLLQAKIFATGHWTAPGRPLPEFFEQTHVFVTPVLASKYPPAHSAALVPGIWLGLPGLVPVLVNGVSGALLFALARRVTHGWIALLTWLIWVTAPGVLEFKASYLSENTSGALCLLGWWLLLCWRETGHGRFLVLLAISTGCEFLTRPLTMLAFAIPASVIVIRSVIVRRAWGEFALSAAVGAALLCVMPLWSARTTGDWRTTPYRQYSRVYYPYQWAGFGIDPTPALRPFPPPMRAYDLQFRQIQGEHQARNLPRIIRERIIAIGRDVWGGGRFLALFAVLGALSSLVEAWFALATAAAVVLSHLVYAHSLVWTPYYLEIQPVLAFVTALGLWRTVSALLGVLTRSKQKRLWWATLANPLAGVLALAVLAPSALQVSPLRSALQEKSAYHRRFASLLAGIQEPKSIVFVRYAPSHNVHRELISNEPDLEAARVWTVYDRGAENAELMRLAPDRAAYLYDDTRQVLVALPRQAGGEASTWSR